MQVESIIKTIPENDVLASIADVRAANLAAMKAQGSAHVARCLVMQRLIDTAKGAGVSIKQALIDIDTAVKGFSLAKNEAVIPAARDAAGNYLYDANGDFVDPGTEWRLGYSMGRAYVKSAEIAFVQGIPFTPSLYHNKSQADKEAKEAAHAEKVRAAELAAEEAAKAAKAAATKAAKAKTDEAKAEAEKAKAEAEKANEAVRAAIDAAPVSQKTGGRKKTKVEPAKVLTRHEVALHATRLVSMLRDLKEPCADEIADILEENNLLIK